MKGRKRNFRLVFMLLFSAGLAGAQTPPPPPTEPPGTFATPEQPPDAEPTSGTKRGEEEIVVTGSRVRRKDLTTPAPVTVLTREQFEESGKVTLGGFLQSLPEQGNAPNFQLNNGGSTYSADGSTRINLRSLGVTRTLVLVNGRRMVNAGLGASSSVDLNSIPTPAVERIEVLKDGASAVYGSDAIAGVVNIITRRTFNNTEVAGLYGTTTRGDAQTFDGSVSTGRSGDFGSFIFSAGYFNQGESWLRDRDFSKFAYTGVLAARSRFQQIRLHLRLHPPASAARRKQPYAPGRDRPSPAARRQPESQLHGRHALQANRDQLPERLV